MVRIIGPNGLELVDVETLRGSKPEVPEVVEVQEVVEEVPVMDLSSLNIKELKKRLAALGIKVSANDKKQDLIDKLNQGSNDL